MGHSGMSQWSAVEKSDRMALIDRVHEITSKLSRASHLLFIAITGLLALVDLMLWATDPVIDTGRFTFSLAILVPCLGVFATFAVALMRRRLASMLMAFSGVSLVLTIASWIIGTSLPPSFASLCALTLLTTTALRREPAKAAVAFTTLAGLAVAAEALRPMVSAAAYLLVVCEAAFGVAVGIGVYLRWTDWRRVTAEETARLTERVELARELHDMVGHYVTGIVVQAQAARHVANKHPEAAIAALQSIEIAGGNAMIATRRMVGGLRSGYQTNPDFTWNEIDELVAQAVAQGQPVRMMMDPKIYATDGLVVTSTLGPSVQRIVTESLTNVQRHAQHVTRIEVSISLFGENLMIRVRNNGLPVRFVDNGRFGIVGMRERVTALGGSLLAGPLPDGGWSVDATLPMRQTR